MIDVLENDRKFSIEKTYTTLNTTYIIVTVGIFILQYIESFTYG